MKRTERSFASKMIGAFTASVLFAVYIAVFFPVLRENLGLQLIAVFFIAYAFIVIIVFPVSLLIDKLARSGRSPALQAFGNVLLVAASLGIALGVLVSIGGRVSSQLALCGLVLIYGYLALDQLLSRIESKYRKMNDAQT